MLMSLLLSVKRALLLHVKRALNCSPYGRTRPGRTALRTAVPRCLLTRKRTEVQLLPRPPPRLSTLVCLLVHQWT